MPEFEVKLDHARRVVVAVAAGELLLRDGKEIITTARRRAAEHGYNILYDLRAATANVELANWYRLPRELPVYHDSNSRLIRAALLASQTEKAIKGYRFYQTVCDNLGYKVRVFFEEAEALEWLGHRAPGTAGAD